MSPEGAQYKTPFPLLLQHDHTKPIGEVTTLQQVGKHLIAGATLVPPGVSPDADYAWSMIKSGGLKGLSIGFHPIAGKPSSTGIDYSAFEIIELSVVTIPCNPQAKILTAADAKSVA
jgi:HK97 family phage prohead protease